MKINKFALFMLGAFSLHSITHIDESQEEDNDVSECLSCHNEMSPDIEIALNAPKRTYIAIEDMGIPKTPDFQISKPFNSQAPPQIKI